MMTTQWRPVPEFPNYEMTVDGQFRRVAHQTAYVRRTGTKSTVSFPVAPVATRLGHRGRLTVRLLHNGVRRTCLVHRLVLWAFGSPPPFPGALALHYDDDPSNNSLDNLRWGTYRNNWEDAQRNGIEVIGRAKRPVPGKLVGG